jgi:hypothetical protein
VDLSGLLLVPGTQVPTWLLLFPVWVGTALLFDVVVVMVYSSFAGHGPTALSPTPTRRACSLAQPRFSDFTAPVR